MSSWTPCVSLSVSLSVVIPGGKTIFVSFPYHHYYHVWLSFWFSLLISLTFCILQRNEKIERETLQAASNFSVCSSLLEKKRMKCSLLLFYARNIVTSDEGSILRETVRKGSPREEWKRARRIMAWRGFKERKRQTQTDNERKRERQKNNGWEGEWTLFFNRNNWKDTESHEKRDLLHSFCVMSVEVEEKKRWLTMTMREKREEEEWMNECDYKTHEGMSLLSRKTEMSDESPRPEAWLRRKTCLLPWNSFGFSFLRRSIWFVWEGSFERIMVGGTNTLSLSRTILSSSSWQTRQTKLLHLPSRQVHSFLSYKIYSWWRVSFSPFHQSLLLYL